MYYNGEDRMSEIVIEFKNVTKAYKLFKNDKKRFDQTNSILSEIYLPYENHQMSLYPYLFSVWIRGG